MADYLVEWRIDVEADSPEEAAAMALAVMRDPESTALHFTVLAHEPGPGFVNEVHLINLNPEDI